MSDESEITVRSAMAEAMRPDADCEGCGAGFFGKAPGRCPKCGGYGIKKPTPIFEDIVAALRRIQMAIDGAEAIVVRRKHRKEAPILGQLRVAGTAIENAMSAVFVEKGVK